MRSVKSKMGVSAGKTKKADESSGVVGVFFRHSLQLSPMLAHWWELQA
jgi:hypothetical protein